MLTRTKPKMINELINPYDGRKPNLPALVTSTGDIAVSSNALTTYVYQTYGFLSVYYPDTFFDCWARHIELYQRSIDRIYYAWNADYDVLDNVNAEETRTITESSTKENTTGVTGNTSANVTGETNNYESTITDTTPVQTSKANTSGNNTSTYSTDSDTNETTTHTVTDEFKRHGNIGVTKSTELIQSEIDLRTNFAMKKLIDTIVEMCGVFYDNEV